MYHFRVATCLLSVLTASAAHVLASAPQVRWTGRTLVNTTDNSVALDWEGTNAVITVANASFIAVQIRDLSANGARFALYLNNTNQTAAAVADPNNYAGATPDLKVAMFATAPQQLYYTLTRGGSAGTVATLTLVLLTEPQFIGDATPQTTLSVIGFDSDGVFLVPDVQRTRRMEVFGDSLTAGYGSGFDFPPNARACGASTMINDITNDYSYLLCSNFTADCQIQAVSGVTLFAASPNLPEIVNYTLGGMIRWPAPNAQLWDYASFAPDAVIINLGENDWHAVNGQPTPAWLAAFVQRYVGFVSLLNDRYRRANVTYFLTIAPHEAGQSVGVTQVVTQLVAAGVRAVFLNATVQEALYPPGCGGHPGPSIHAAAAARAQPVIAATMGW